MTSTNEETTILKSDTRGRVRVPVERREELLKEFDRSGISAMKFSRLAGIKYPTFANWLAKRRRMGGGAQALGGAESGSNSAGRPVRLFEAVAEPERRFALGGTCLTIEFSGGARLLVESPAQLPMVAELLALAAQNLRSRC
jgi:hypothetical protein